MRQDLPREEAVEEAVEEEEGEHSHYPGKHLPNLLKHFWETHRLSLQENEPRSTPSSPNGNYTAV